jgi:hypothetical protein
MPLEGALQLRVRCKVDVRCFLYQVDSEDRCVKGIFDTKPNSGYDDEVTRRYHFPPQYRVVAEKARW